MSQRRYELTDFEWSIIEPLLPGKARGVPRADDRKVLNGIYWRRNVVVEHSEIAQGAVARDRDYACAKLRLRNGGDNSGYVQLRRPARVRRLSRADAQTELFRRQTTA